MALNLALTALLLFTLRRGVRAAGTLSDAMERGERLATRAEARNRPLSGLSARRVDSSSAPQVDLGSLRNAVVMVFDTACVPCAGTMEGWTGILREAKDGEAVALTVEPGMGAAEYWRPWASVRVLVADTTVMRDELKLVSTPTTLVVEGGAVRHEYRGPLSLPARHEITESLRRWHGEREGREQAGSAPLVVSDSSFITGPHGEVP
jgi:hypothetical protein